jgi:hypothetical protein
VTITIKKKSLPTKKVKTASLKSFWVGVEDTFKAKVKGIRELLRHQASGAAIESYFRDLLCSYLPRRYIIEPGFVVTAQGQMSDYIDLLVVDALHIPPLCNDPPVRIFAAESVVAAIEITSAPLTKAKRAGLGKIPKLQDDALKLAGVRRLTWLRQYSDIFPIINADGTELKLKQLDLVRKLSPRTVLITCGAEGLKKTFETNLIRSLKEAHEINDHAWVHLVYSLKHGLYRFKTYTEFEYRHLAENALLEFLLRLNNIISTYPTYRTDITRYRVSLNDEPTKDDPGGTRKVE